MADSRTSRRSLLAGVGVGVTGGMAGCLDSSGGSTDESGGDNGGTDEPEGDNGGTDDSGGDRSDTVPPTREAEVPLAFDHQEIANSAESGGVGKDGIPSIDEPSFEGADAADGRLADGAVVFGVEIDGDAKAYPQHILVWHEIVNDTVGGLPVSVSYCPLTGTAIGFERGETTLGVSGRLINSNLVMYDRETDSWWPQVLGEAVDGEHVGAALYEVPVVWTTWGRWRDVYPDTQVLTTDTNYARNYDSDPYGSYNPTEGYYESGGANFPVLNEDDRLDPKDVVIGARSQHGAVAVEKDHLREAELVETTLDEVSYLMVYDGTLDTGYAYRNADGADVERSEDGYRVDGETHAPDELGLERVNAFDAMWFAWAGFYPETELHE